MSGKYQLVKGFRDILPKESVLFWRVETKARELFSRFGYQEIILPLVEPYELFSRSIGDETEIVEKEMFSFIDKKGEKITLRPEATASVVRAYIDNFQSQDQAKLFYSGPMFRYERPQKGRYRQFWQIGAEAIGYLGPGTDAELIALLDEFFRGFGLELELKLNSLGCANCRPKYKTELLNYLEKAEAFLCADCKKRVQRNPLRILDCKNPDCQGVAKKAPSSLEFLCLECKEHFEKLKNLLGLLKISYQIEPHLVRGLDYYTKTVFEFQAKTGLGAQNAVCGGGRYDELVEELGGAKTPAIGFALGVERLVILLKEKIPEKELLIEPEVYLIFVSESAYQFCFKLLFALRKQRIYAEMSIDEPSRSLRAQLKQADKLKAKTALIIGEDEIKNKALNLKILATGKELKVEHQTLKRMAEVDWEEMRNHLNSIGFAFVSQKYEKSLIENQSLFNLMKVYLAQLELEEK